MKCLGLHIFVAIILCVRVRVCARVRVMDVITLKLDKSAQLLFTRMVCWPQSGSPHGFLFNTIL